jgi:hypothetical protein
MKNILSKQKSIQFTVVAMLSLLCAGSAMATSNAEALLLSAGFKAKAATTAKQRQELKTLPEGKVSPVTQNGKTFYVYADRSRNQLYVGKEAEYQIYRNLSAKARSSAGPIVTTIPNRGNPIKVREIYGFGPLDDMR